MENVGKIESPEMFCLRCYIYCLQDRRMLAQINKTFARYLHVSVPVAVLLK